MTGQIIPRTKNFGDTSIRQSLLPIPKPRQRSGVAHLQSFSSRGHPAPLSIFPLKQISNVPSNSSMVALFDHGILAVLGWSAESGERMTTCERVSARKEERGCIATGSNATDPAWRQPYVPRQSIRSPRVRQFWLQTGRDEEGILLLPIRRTSTRLPPAMRAQIRAS